MGDFVKVGEVKDFREGRGRAVRLDGVEIAVFRVGDRFLAFTDACPHMGASLADGKLVGDKVECVWHGWKYDVHTGKNDWKEWACLTIYETKTEGQDVLIRRPDPPPAPPEPEQEEDWVSEDPTKFIKKKDVGAAGSS